jgi:hypothetical protein
MIKGKEEIHKKGKDKIKFSAMTDTKLEEIDFIVRSTYNPVLRSFNYSSNFQKRYPNPACAPENGANNGNH